MRPPQDTPSSNTPPKSDGPGDKLPPASMRMINDIRGMQRPPRPGQAASTQTHPQPSPAAPQPAAPPQQPTQATTTHPNGHLIDAPHAPRLEDGQQSQPPKKKRSKLKIFLGVLGVLIIAVAAAIGYAFWWYQQQLQPVEAGSEERVRVEIPAGSSPSIIAETLHAEGIIRDRTAFAIYTKISKTENTLKAGIYNLKKSESVQQIVDHLVAGKQDTFTLTFLPGDTLANNRKKLIQAGYEEAEVDAALAKQYDRPLFAGKPVTADLEGYIFGETYEFTSDVSVEMILNRTFDEYEKYIKQHDLVNGYKKLGMNLYQGITLASIIQKEVSGPEDSRQVSQVFHKRLKDGMPLGADATFVYAAKKEGRQPTVDFDSLYNTRIHKGLPPGPISAPGLNALQAAANPAPGDYLYFVSGDDGKNYFSRTLQEHEANTRAHCIKNCSLF